MRLVTQLGSAELTGSNGSIIDYFDKYNIDSVAVYVQKKSDGLLYIAEKSSLFDLNPDNCVSFEEFSQYVSTHKSYLYIQCILMEPALEMEITEIALRHEILDLIHYSGDVNPVYISKWNRDKIIFSIETALPRIYKLDSIKRAHLDVIHYFCRKYSIKTILIKSEYCTEEIMDWCEESDLDLSILDVANSSDINCYRDMGIESVITDLDTMIDYQDKYQDLEIY